MRKSEVSLPNEASFRTAVVSMNSEKQGELVLLIAGTLGTCKFRAKLSH